MKTEILDKKAIAQNLKSLRMAKGKTVADMSEATGIGATAIRNYESGLRIPNYRAMFTIAQYYNRSVDSIFFRTR